MSKSGEFRRRCSHQRESARPAAVDFEAWLAASGIAFEMSISFRRMQAARFPGPFSDEKLKFHRDAAPAPARDDARKRMIPPRRLQRPIAPQQEIVDSERDVGINGDQHFSAGRRS